MPRPFEPGSAKPKPKYRVWQGFRYRVGSGLDKWLRLNRNRLLGIVKQFPKPVKKVVSLRRKNRAMFMFDDVNVSLIPKNAKAVAGYVDGWYKTAPVMETEFPNAWKVKIAVKASDDADCLDVETGDANPGQAPAWVARQIKNGVKRPIVYASVSLMPAVLSELAKAGIKRSAVRVWTAHYTGKAHRCNKKCSPFFNTVADATQFTDKAQGKSLDESLVAPSFFPPGKPV